MLRSRQEGQRAPEDRLKSRSSDPLSWNQWWFNGGLMGFNGIYPLVMTNSSPWFFDGPCF